MTAYALSGDHVAAEVVDDELIIMNMTAGSYYSAVGSGRALWHLLLSGADADAVISLMAERAGDPGAFADAARGIVRMLCDDGLIVPVAPSRTPGAADVAGPTPLALPTIEVHHDMEDILMLDPIHDVGAAGWPIRPAAVGR